MRLPAHSLLPAFAATTPTTSVAASSTPALPSWQPPRAAAIPPHGRYHHLQGGPWQRDRLQRLHRCGSGGKGQRHPPGCSRSGFAVPSTPTIAFAAATSLAASTDAQRSSGSPVRIPASTTASTFPAATFAATAVAAPVAGAACSISAATDAVDAAATLAATTTTSLAVAVATSANAVSASTVAISACTLAAAPEPAPPVAATPSAALANSTAPLS